MKKLVEKNVAFMAIILGATDRWKGKNMKEIH